MCDKVCNQAVKCVQKGNLNMLKYIYHTNPASRDPYVFQRVFLSACAHHHMSILTWLYEIYDTLDAVHKVLLRHTIIHGKYLLKNKKITQKYKELFKSILV